MERKFTDDEIVKALECCTSDKYTCSKCPYEDTKHIKNEEFEIMPNGKSYDEWSCDEWLKCDLLNLINRQKAEMERLKEAYALYEETTGLKWARAEAIKKFANMLKLDLGDMFLRSHNCVESIIDNLVKEMTGENNGN